MNTDQTEAILRNVKMVRASRNFTCTCVVETE